MRQYSRWVTVAAVWALSLGAAPAAQRIKLGSLAPEGSPWHEALKQMAADWREASGGEIQLKIYPGGIVGDESDMLRKMRFGQLNAAGLTVNGMVQISKDLAVTQLPLVFRSEDELQYVLEKMKPTFEQAMEKKGFKVLIWTMAGWAYMFSREPVMFPADLRRQKLQVLGSNPHEHQALKQMEFQIVPLSVPETMTALQSGMVDAVTATPVSAAALQWFGLARNMCSIRWGPMLGGVVIAEKTWKRIPADVQAKIMTSARKIEESLQEETAKLDGEAIEIMKKHGLVIHQVPPEAEAEWRAIVEKARNEIYVGRSIDRAVYEQVTKHLDDFRSSTKKQ